MQPKKSARRLVEGSRTRSEESNEARVAEFETERSEKKRGKL